MPWAFVRPRDLSVLDGRPLLDLGTGDGQTLRAITDRGMRVGVDRSLVALRSARLERAVCADAFRLPFADGAFRTILAADVFHHTAALDLLAAECARVLDESGRLVAWWYARAGRGGPGDPAHPRSYDAVSHVLTGTGFAVSPLDLDVAERTPDTVGCVAER